MSPEFPATDFVFNGKNYRPYFPEDIPDPISVYGGTKLKGEQAVLEELKNSAVIIRTARHPFYSVLDKISLWLALNIKPVHWRRQLIFMLKELGQHNTQEQTEA